MRHTNYDEMTNKQLNIEIATRKGWRVEEWQFPEPEGFALISPDGSTITVSDTEEYAWDNLPPVPADDANTALELMTTACFINLSPTLEGWFAHLVVDKGRDVIVFDYTIVDKTPARAICVCWLMWQDAKASANASRA